MESTVAQPHLVIIGGGFGGLYCARTAARLRPDLRITLVDRKNHHVFQPLLYQVASAVLSPADIASPIRTILRHQQNVQVLLEEAVGFDLERRIVRLRGCELQYDFLVIAAGATHSYFGHDEWEPLAPGLKNIEDALEIRRRVLLAYELAERDAVERNAQRNAVVKVETGHAPSSRETQQREVSLVVIGGGPTGVELAGALADIARYALAYDFRQIDPRRSRVILLEGGPRVLPAYAPDLSRSAQEQLTALGVEVRTNALVTAIESGRVRVQHAAASNAGGSSGAATQEWIPADVVLWAAGVAASPLGRMLGAPTDRAGRVLVEPDLSIAGHPEVFVIGDLAAFRTPDGNFLPGVAPVAIQEGRYVARNIVHALARTSPRIPAGEPRKPFVYRDKGNLATIGRAAAVAQLGRLHISGGLAWLMWLFVHILYLIGFRNRFLVMTEWAWAYFTKQRGIRLITGSDENKT